MASLKIPVERCREVLDELDERLARAPSEQMRACYQGLIGHWRAELRKAEVAEE